MRNKLLLKIILITTVALMVGISLSLAIFNYINITTVQENLNQSSELIVKGLDLCNNVEDLREFLRHSDQVLFLTVFDSNNQILYDTILESTGDSSKINPKYTGDAKYLVQARERGFSFKIGRPYVKDATMLMHSVAINNDKFDPNGSIVLRSCMVIVYNNDPFWTSVFIGVLIWIAIVVGAYIVINESIKVAVSPFTEIESSLRDLSKGEFHKMNLVHCGDKEIDNLFTQLGEISDQVLASFEELKNEQAKSKFLLQSISQGVMALSNMGTIMLHNHALEEILETDDLGGVSIDYVLEGEILDIVKKALEDKNYSLGTIHKEKDVYRVECIPIEMNDSSELSNIKLLVVFTDITQEIETSNIRNEFFANASHELKTPLTAISGYSEIITLGNRDTNTIQKCAKEIMNNATKMKDLINDMMRLSKLDARLDVEDETTFDIYEVCKNVVDDQYMIAKNKKVDLSLEGDSANIFARKNMIKVVVENIVNNAIKYNKENGSVKVIVSQDSKYTTVAVKDTGIGIPKEHQGRLFERFYKVDNARTRTEESSTGLGLAIVKHIILMHKAQIHVDSKEGVGTTMTIRFNNIVNK